MLGLFKKPPLPPPEPYSFSLAFKLFQQRMGDWKKMRRATPNGRRIGVLVTPWLNNPVPMYSLEIALELHRAGCDIVCLLDDTDLRFNTASPAAVRKIHKLLDGLPADFETVHDSACEPAAMDTAPLGNFIFENAVWLTKGEETARAFVAENPDLESLTQLHLARIRAALGGQRLDWLLLPGGFFGLSGLYRRAAESLGLDFTTYDSGPGRFFAAHRGVAAQSGDIPEAFGELQTQIAKSPKLGERIEKIARQAEEDRQQLRDPFQFQTTARGSGTGRGYDILLCLNYRADTAALERNRAFDTVAEWVSSVIRWAQQQGGLTVGIRQHPVQRHERVKSTDRIDLLVHSLDPERQVATWIDAKDPVSTYDLLPAAKVVLPYTSTIGIEAAMHGKPVVMCAHCYYDTLGFVSPASTPEEYFHLLRRACNGNLPVSDGQKKMAAACLYLMMKCRSVHSPFTPQRDDFMQWINTPPAQLWKKDTLSDLREALLTRTPLTLIRHRRIAAS